MLEHPEISWIERTGYPSWLQERREGTPVDIWKEEDRWDDHNGN